MADGDVKTEAPGTPEVHPFLAQLRTFQQRLLQVDARNPSVFTGKIARRRNFDLTTLGSKIADKAFAHVVARGGRQRLVDEGSMDREVMSQREHLRLVAKTAADREEETGLDDLRLATAWIEGQLDERSYVRAPLLLSPAKLTRVRGTKAGWTLELQKDGDIQFNQALLGALAKSLRWSWTEEAQGELVAKIEELAKNKHKTPDALLQAVAEALRAAALSIVTYDDTPRSLKAVTKAEALTGALDDEEGPREGLCLRGYVLVGVFPQSSTALYQDYEELARRAEAGEVDQGIIDNLLETPGDPQDGDSDDGALPDGPLDLDDVPASKVHVALPCDPSQYAVLCEAQSAECTVVRGPPGTGKSQVIANLLVDALSRGERALVVCQKRAALDVVQARLRATGLTPWTYVVHDATADHKEVYEQLRQALQLSRRPAGPDAKSSLAAVSAEIDRTKGEIRSIVDPLRTQTHGRPLSQWYRQAPSGQRLPSELPQELVALNWDELQRLLEQLGHLRDDAVTFSGEGAPLRSRKSWSGHGPAQAKELVSAIDRVIDAAAGQRGALVVVPRETLNSLRDVLGNYRRLVGRWWRFLSPQWWRTRKQFRAGTSVLGAEAPEQWDASLDVATQVRQGIETLNEFFDTDWIAGVEQELQSSPNPPAMLDEIRTVVREDFDRVVALDRRLSQLEPWTQRLLPGQDPQMFALVGLDSGSSSSDHWVEAIRRNVLLHWIEQVEAEHPALRGEPFVEYRRLRDRLVELLEQQASLTAQSVVREVHAESRRRELPPELQGARTKPETIWNKLEHELNKQRRLWPLRKTLREFAWPLRHLARAWLLSPEVAAEILPLERSCFDVAIFDEASQLPLERALPVLYRCKRVVIAGDEQQMPPSRFFESAFDDEELDEEGEPIEDARAADSLLEQAKKIYGFRYLGWHYRSEYGELIDFSNQAFYDGSLHITPPPMRRSAIAPITFHPVDGVWDKQVNFAEAERCVQLIESIARAHRDAPKSIGVVAVNLKQQQAIDEALRQAEEARPELAELVHQLRHPASGSRDDALIIKNIENIQGDERDIIIFSTAFARPPGDRTMRRNFGAISRAGGENRLNVAFTRARREMHILCSFDPNEVPVQTLKNRGPRILMRYLAYAKAVSEGRHEVGQALLDALGTDTNRPAERNRGPLQFDSDFEETVYEALRSRGLELDTQVGAGGYRIDLAIVDPRDSSRYCLAIECDGATYHSGRNVRERDIARQELLERRGWVFERIWSRDWWRDAQGEVERIVQRVKALTQ